MEQQGALVHTTISIPSAEHSSDFPSILFDYWGNEDTVTIVLQGDIKDIKVSKEHLKTVLSRICQELGEG